MHFHYIYLDPFTAYQTKNLLHKRDCNLLTDILNFIFIKNDLDNAF